MTLVLGLRNTFNNPEIIEIRISVSHISKSKNYKSQMGQDNITELLNISFHKFTIKTAPQCQTKFPNESPMISLWFSDDFLYKIQRGHWMPQHMLALLQAWEASAEVWPLPPPPEKTWMRTSDLANVGDVWVFIFIFGFYRGNDCVIVLYFWLIIIFPVNWLLGLTN